MARRFFLTSRQAHLNGSDTDWRLSELDRQYALFNQRSYCDVVVGWLAARRRVCEGLFGCNQESATTDQFKIPDNFNSAREREEFFAQRDQDWFAVQSQKEKTLAEATRRFKPQPYLQLAQTYRTAGYRAATRNVLVRLERNETRYSDIRLIVILWRWLLDLTIQYGHALSRPIIILAVWAVVSAAIFEGAAKKLFRSKRIPQLALRAKAVWCLNSLIFAIDTLLPIVDFNQKKGWTVNPISSSGAHDPAGSIGAFKAFCWVWRQIPERWAPALLIFNTFFGWLMTTLFAAGISGLIRTSRD